jgi:hypothetical protein
MGAVQRVGNALAAMRWRQCSGLLLMPQLIAEVKM